ncbi:MAG: tocopherol cyclase family protein [Clostridia bacterium]
MKNGSFEGWYFKQNTRSGKYAIAFIPGRATDKNGNAHAFIQINHSFEGDIKHSYYLRFPIAQYFVQWNPLEIRIAENRFTLDGIVLDIKTADIELKTNLAFVSPQRYKKNAFSPGIMGPFGYLPFLECYHELYSLSHRTVGKMTVNGEVIDFEGGNGYVEGDHGTSFPEKWIWFQSNHFQKDVSVFCAIAKVPILPLISKALRGLICVFLIEGKEYRFTTYNGAKVVRILTEFEGTKEVLIVELRKGSLQMKMSIFGGQGSALMAPANGSMEGIIKENIDAQVKVELFQNDFSIFCGTGINCGYEKNWD